ncbi:unnamed protein product, partial [Darwinula stevensoni]
VSSWLFRYYFWLAALCCFIFPAITPWRLWGEDLWVAFWFCSVTRCIFVVNGTFLVNSAAHLWGTKPYDKNIIGMEQPIVGALALGEGWHNYHHVFPWDYKTSELPLYRLNLTTMFIDAAAFLGQAYDLKTVDPKVVEQRVKRTGDGSHFEWGDEAERREKEQQQQILIPRPSIPNYLKTNETERGRKASTIICES